MKTLLPWLAAAFLLAGCSGIDIWSVDEETSPSRPYRPGAPPPLPRARASGTPDVEGKVLALEDCLHIALRRNAEARASWHASRAAAARAGASRAGFFPSLTASGSLRRSDTVSPATGASLSPRTEFAGSLGVSLLVFDGLGRWASVAAANAERDELGFRHSATLSDIVLRVKEAYFGLLAAKDLLAAMEAARRQSQVLQAMARARHENGLVPRGDVLRADTNLAEADLHLTRARNSVHTARGRLAVAMGLPVDTGLRVPASVPVAADRTRREVAALLGAAARQRPELRAALAGVKKEQAGLDRARAAWWPTVTIEGTYGYRDDVFLPRQDEWSLGVGFRAPVFSGFGTGYGVREARARVAEAEARLESLLRQVEFAVWTRFHEVADALGSLRASKALMASATESVLAAEEEYKNGAGSMPDLIAAQAKRTAARAAVVRVSLDLRLAGARLEHAVGGR